MSRYFQTKPTGIENPRTTDELACYTQFIMPSHCPLWTIIQDDLYPTGISQMISLCHMIPCVDIHIFVLTLSHYGMLVLKRSQNLWLWSGTDFRHGAEIWGLQTFLFHWKSANYRAIRYFLGLTSRTPTAACHYMVMAVTPHKYFNIWKCIVCEPEVLTMLFLRFEFQNVVRNKSSRVFFTNVLIDVYQMLPCS
jgi:hypothetical protein